MKQLFIHNAYFRILCPPVYGLVVYVLVLLVFDSVGQITENFFSQEVLLCIVLTYLLSESLRLMIDMVNRYLPAEKDIKILTATQLAVNMLCSLTVISGGVAIYFYFIVGYSTFQVELLTLNSIYLLTTFLYTLLYLSIYFLQKHSTEKLTQETALRKKMEHQLQQLKQEVNPGLLYNSLETLISLVQQDAGMAEIFIDRLSSLYRYTLDHRHKELIALEKELHALQDMAYLYNHKFEGKIKVTICIAEEEQALLLLPGSLPELMENSILSTIMHPGFVLAVDVYVEDSFVVLHYPSNNRLLLHNPVQETIHRLSQTYSFFTDKRVVYQPSQVECIIKLPLLQEHPVVDNRTHSLTEKPQVIHQS
ncbi:histidine kinase [Rhodocytophaga aerolata]|uniref:Histidine kinase n=1 Tax=Rhodocytophaga aerolata TaxID=455078 RepID=A0ABT8RAN5_9BACT|nr:histidine kinase [Rhodocytophaga aerolata]MDO1449165.1 histidine kinase [Rhodocytophaga aerolata]